jgi:hypothetical protein
MPLYELKSTDNLPLLTISAMDDESLENDLIMFANAIIGIQGTAFVEKKGEYWKVVYNRKGGSERFLIVKRKDEQ